jgi:hypothetical protein
MDPNDFETVVKLNEKDIEVSGAISGSRAG